MDEGLSLLFALEEPVSDAVPGIASLVRTLNDARTWNDGEIAFIDDVDESSSTRDDDLPFWTLGGLLTLTQPTTGRGAEQSQLDDVEFLIKRLCEFSSRGYTFVVEYAGEAVGWIENGRMDASLREGLLAEWRRRVDGR